MIWMCFSKIHMLKPNFQGDNLGGGGEVALGHDKSWEQRTLGWDECL